MCVGFGWSLALPAITRKTNRGLPRYGHWRPILSDNVLSIYGKNLESRICDLADPRRVFSWLICETRDHKGNAILDQGRVNAVRWIFELELDYGNPDPDRQTTW